MMKRPKPLKAFKNIVRKRPAINEVVKEPTAGGVVWRRGEKGIEILLIQDAKDRWTIPKGHIEEGENAKDTAVREIEEETGLKDTKIQHWLGKINFRYRRQQSLVLMTTEIYLVEALKNSDDLKPEEWMKGIRWMPVNDALDKIEYEDIAKLILKALKLIREHKV